MLSLDGLGWMLMRKTSPPVARSKTCLQTEEVAEHLYKDKLEQIDAGRDVLGLLGDFKLFQENVYRVWDALGLVT